MKAIQFTEYGGPEVLKLIDIMRPVPVGHEVLIEIKAIGVNFADTARREGKYVVKTPLPYVPGAEVAGIIREVGDQVTRFKVGMPVVTLLGSKKATGYAEYSIADDFSLIPIPEGVDFNHAVSIPLQGLTAYHILKTSGHLQQGESVLVHAAAGGVGTLAVQLAKLFGAGKVIATASTDEKLALAKSLGADALVNYTEEGWEQQILEINEGKGIDVALEMVGGDIFHKTLSILAPFGRLVTYGVASREEADIKPSLLMGKNLSVNGFFLPQIMSRPKLYMASLKELLHYIQEGQLKLTIGGVYPLEEAANVHTLLESRKTSGKLVLVP